MCRAADRPPPAGVATRQSTPAAASSPRAGRSRTRRACAPTAPSSGSARRRSARGPSTADAGPPAGPRTPAGLPPPWPPRSASDGRTAPGPSSRSCRTAPGTANRPMLLRPAAPRRLASATAGRRPGLRRAASPLGAGFPRVRSVTIGQTTLAQLRVERLQGIDLRHRNQEAPPAKPSSRSTCPFSLGRRTRQKCSWNR